MVILIFVFFIVFVFGMNWRDIEYIVYVYICDRKEILDFILIFSVIIEILLKKG